MARTLVPEDQQRTGGARRIGRQGRWHDLRWPQLAAVAVVLLLGLGGLVLGGLLGLRDGLELRRDQRATAVVEHYERGLRYLDSSEMELAGAEFAHVLSLQPLHEQALAQLRVVEQAKVEAAKDTPGPGPTPTPLPVATPEEGPSGMAALHALMADATQMHERQQWGDAVLRLEQLRAIAPDYQPDVVAALLFEAHYEHGLQLADSGHLEAALRSLGQALALRPDDAAVREQQELLGLYAEALGIWRANWSETIGILNRLYTRQPGYRDVEQRLLEARRAYGDVLAARSEWCAAAQQYAEALTIRSDPDLVRLREDADYACRTATPTPPLTTPLTTPVDGVLPPLPRPAVGSGLIAYSAMDQLSGQQELWLLPADGGEVRLLSVQASQPALSPDGLCVAFRSHRNDMLGLALAPAEGGEWQRVTRHVEDGAPTWAPDGERIAFASNREGDRKWRIYQVWAHAGEPATTVAFGRSPAWSPDGAVIAYQGCNPEGAQCGLWSVSLQDGAAQALTTVAGDTAPAWSPDGQRLAFASPERTGNWDLFLLDLGSELVTPLAAHPAVDYAPAWSPDGRRLAFVSNRDGGWGIYVLDLTTGQAPVLIQSLWGLGDDWLSQRIGWR